MSVIVVIRYQARPDQIAAAHQTLADLIATVVRTEPDCLGIRMHQETADPTRILLWEEWTTEAAFTGPHSVTPHLTAFKARARELYAGPPEISFWRETERVGG